MSQLLSNILSNITLPPYPSFFVRFKHTIVTHHTKISRFSITVTPPPPPPQGYGLPAPPLNWFNRPIVCPFREKLGTYYSKKHGRLRQLGKEMTVIALGFYLIMGTLQVLQTSLNMLWSMFNQLWPTCSIRLKYFYFNPRFFPRPFRH